MITKFIFYFILNLIYGSKLKQFLNPQIQQQLSSDLKQQFQNINPQSFLQIQDKSDISLKQLQIEQVRPNYIYKQIWASFFRFDPNLNPIECDPKFFINEAFYEQSKYKEILPQDNITDIYGFINIPTEKSFYMVLMKDNLYVLAGRRNMLANSLYSLRLEDIKKLGNQDKDLDGIQDMGQFSEGFCLKLLTKQDAWIICVQDNFEQKDLMNQLKLLMEKHQTDVDIKPKKFLNNYETRFENYPLPPTPANQYKTVMINNQKIEVLNKDLESNGKVDGYWVMIQDWSTCTQSCGGGTQTRQRTCIPPRNGGKECVGQPLENRYCNTQDCDFKISNQKEQKIENKELPLKVQSYRVSMRPQREETCIVKEGDLDMIDLKQHKESQMNIRLPVRVIMNNMTFSIFAENSQNEILFSCPLKMIEVEDVDKEETCIMITDTRCGEKKKICSMQNQVQGHSQLENIQRWKQQILYFQENCQDQLQVFNSQFQEQAQKQVIKLKEKEIEEEKQDDEIKLLQDKSVKTKEEVKNFTNIIQESVDAITKEMTLESLIEREEAEREMNQEEEEKLRMMKQNEKEENFERIERKNKKIQMLSFAEDGSELQMKQLKDQVKSMLILQRQMQQKKLDQMKKLSDRAKRQKDKKQLESQEQLGKKMTNAFKKGDSLKCDPGQTKEQIEEYCNENFNTELDLVTDCKDKDFFCFMCCQKEFGAFNPQERQECQGQCKIPISPAKEQGAWVWMPSIKQDPKI